MEKNKQTQTAGDNAQQIQAQTIIVNNGIDEKRVREIFDETYKQQVQLQTLEAERIAKDRNDAFVGYLIERLQKVENSLEALTEPSINYDLAEAQKHASCTDNDGDYQLLSELLARRIEEKNNRVRSLNIRKAISVVDQIDEKALCALTVFAVFMYYPASYILGTDIDVVLSCYSYIFQSLMYKELPKGNSWVQHLQLLDLANNTHFSHFTDFGKYLSEKFVNLINAGIKKDSEKYYKALELLREVEISKSSLVENKLNPSYVVLKQVNQKEDIGKLSIIRNDNTVPIDEKSKNALETIFDMYDKDFNKKVSVSEELLNRWDSYDSLRKIHEWWDSFGEHFEITPVGRVLAFSNGSKYNSLVPKWIE